MASRFLRFFKKKETHILDPEASEQYLKFRDLILGLDPTQLDSDLPDLWGALIDIAHPELRFTVVALADGTTSVYAGGGAARVGFGEHPTVAKMSKDLLAVAEKCANSMMPASDFPLPTIGRVRFYVFTLMGKLMTDRSIDELDGQNDDFSLLYRISSAIITEIRIISELWQEEQQKKSSVDNQGVIRQHAFDCGLVYLVFHVASRAVACGQSIRSVDRGLGRLRARFLDQH